MFDQLSQYLFQYKSLNIPSVGLFKLRTQQAALNITKGVVEAPGWQIDFVQQTAEQDPEQVVSEQSPNLFDWLSKKNDITTEEAISQFEIFKTSLQNQLNSGEPVSWDGVGQFIKNQGTIRFTSSQTVNTLFAPIAANTVIRENQNYKILVGTRETDTEQMRHELSEVETSNRFSKILPLLLLALALLGLIGYFIKNGTSVSNTGNQQRIEIAKPIETYKIP